MPCAAEYLNINETNHDSLFTEYIFTLWGKYEKLRYKRTGISEENIRVNVELIAAVCRHRFYKKLIKALDGTQAYLRVMLLSFARECREPGSNFTHALTHES